MSFGGRQSNVSMTIIGFRFPRAVAVVAGEIQVHAKMSAFQRFLQDFAAGSNTLDVDSQDS